MLKPEIITALDFNNFDDARNLVNAVGNAIDYYKVGLESYISCGNDLIRFLADSGKKIFLDLKFHDIPNTVSGAVLSSLKYNVDIINMHIQGGTEMIADSVAKVDGYCKEKNIKRPLLIGVTLLTSLNEDYLSEYRLDFATSLDYVIHLAGIAKKAGLDGVVSSAKETVTIKKRLGSDFLTITPGIRPSYEAVGDQKRVVTPRDAKDMGTDFIVIGRPITKAADPVAAVNKILEEING